MLLLLYGKCNRKLFATLFIAEHQIWCCQTKKMIHGKYGSKFEIGGGGFQRALVYVFQFMTSKQNNSNKTVKHDKLDSSTYFHPL